MIEFLKGKLVEKNPAYAVLECNGIGYLVNISLNTFSFLKPDSDCKLLIHYNVNVDVRSGSSNHTLFGFTHNSERELFRHLISVSGVSSNTARMILSSLNPEEVQKAIIGEDVNTIKSVKGIGPKLAQKIISELKEKVMKDGALQEISLPQSNTNKDEALSALIALGFVKHTAEKVLNKILSESPDLQVEELVKKGLKLL